MKVGIISAERIGKVHAKTIADPLMQEGVEAFAKRYGIPFTVPKRK